MVREAALKKLNSLQTDELVKLSKMCSEKGRKALKTKWLLIKTFTTTRLKVLGFIVDTMAFTFSVPIKRIVAAESLLRELLASGRRRGPVRARDLAKAVGRVISMGLALGRDARRMTRCCYRALAVATGCDPDATRWEIKAAWSTELTLPQDALTEMAFWADTVDGVEGPSVLWLAAIRGAPISEAGDGTRLSMIELAAAASSDASDHAVGCWAQEVFI